MYQDTSLLGATKQKERLAIRETRILEQQQKQQKHREDLLRKEQLVEFYRT